MLRLGSQCGDSALLYFAVIVAILSTSFQSKAQSPGGGEFNFNPGVKGLYVEAAIPQLDGKILLVGSFTNVNGLVRSNITRLNYDGSADTNFNIGVGADNSVLCAALQWDSHILIAGDFTAIDGHLRNRLARLNPDGTLEDTNTFQLGDGANGSIRAMALQPDGKILIAGDFTTVNGEPRGHIARLNPDGTLDAFTPGSGANSTIFTVAVQSDGKVVIGGAFTKVDGLLRNRVARLSPDGTLENTNTFNPGTGFNADVLCSAVQPNGKILIGGAFTNLNGRIAIRVARLNPNGTPEGTNTFNPVRPSDNAVSSIALQADGKILLAGSFTKIADSSIGRLVRMYPNGALDFNITSNPEGPVRGVTLQGDGKILIGGEFLVLTSQNVPRVARLFNDTAIQVLNEPNNSTVRWIRSGGSPEVSDIVFELSTDAGASWRTLGSPAHLTNGWQLTGLNLPPNGALRARGRCTGGLGNGSSMPFQQVVVIAGSLDPFFNTSISGEQFDTRVTAMAVQPDGKILIGGSFTNVNGQPRRNLVRLNADGTVESTTTFRIGTGVDQFIKGIIVQPDHKILIYGLFHQVNGLPRERIARLNPDGSLESLTTFDPGSGPTSWIETAALQPDGKILIAGPFAAVNGQTRFEIARLNPDGSVESTNTFHPGSGPSSDVYAIALQPDGRILIGGYFTAVNGQKRNYFARLYSDGTLEDTNTFNLGSGANERVYSLVPQPDGKVLIAGEFTTLNGQPRNYFARLNPDGTLESTNSFRAGGGLRGYPSAICLQADGNILIAGRIFDVYGKIGRLLPDGTLELKATFDTGTGGAGNNNSDVDTLALQPDGRIVAGGRFLSFNDQPHNLIVRLLNDPAPQALKIPAPGTLRWERSISSPEIDQVTFEISTNNGTTWDYLGPGARLDGGWEFSGAGRPLSGAFRASGSSITGTAEGSAGRVETTFALHPHIAVEETSGTNLLNGSSASFGSLVDGLVTNRAFTIRNLGSGELIPLNITIVGSDKALFTVVTNPVAPVIPLGYTTFAVQFAPETPGVKTAVLQIAHNGTDENPFAITLAGSGLNSPPSITACVTNHSISAGANCQVAMPDLIGLLVVEDFEDRSLLLTQTPTAGTLIGIGQHSVTFMVTDTGGLSDVCSATVTVADRTPPSLTCHTDMVVECTGPAGAVAEFPISAFDDCDPQPVVICTPPSGSLFLLGRTTVSCSATDANTNQASCIFTVTVVDTTPPIILCPSDLTFEESNAGEGARATFTVTVSDVCDLQPAIACSPPSGSIFPVGTTRVQCTAWDENRNSAVCSFSVTVHELTPRAIKSNALQALLTLRQTLSNQRDVQMVDQAIVHLAQSLDPGLWLDASHLERQHGERVFQEEKDAIQNLCDMMTATKGKPWPTNWQYYISQLFQADRMLAATAITEAIRAGVSAKKISQAQQFLARGVAASTDQKCGSGMEDYKNAWKHVLLPKVSCVPSLLPERIQLKVVGDGGTTYAIQVSANLRDWVTIAMLKANSNGIILWEDSRSQKPAIQYYRILEP
ncbi:MAG: hypothetical protein JWM16_5462 [Verrucomicrobiales bacterium]|nr:hypothetical protein [Verrucomicrobiales bacterium]